MTENTTPVTEAVQETLETVTEATTAKATAAKGAYSTAGAKSRQLSALAKRLSARRAMIRPALARICASISRRGARAKMTGPKIWPRGARNLSKSSG